MANINLPYRFKVKLEENQYLDGLVRTTLSVFGEILEDNKLFFFEDYTDHGIKHIESVIRSSDNLIPESSFNQVLTDKDIAYYILSVVLHDIGMHLRLEGFVKLIDGEFDNIRNSELDKLSWKELWEDFLNEAKKFNGKQLKEIFGDANTIIKAPPLNNPGKINANDKRLIGEFLRRHHPRLAHEIAILGLPGKSFLEFANTLDTKERYIIGFIARSHGMDLRNCVDHVENFFGKDNRRYPLNIHAIYLMVLLRIADYIQIDNTRTSKTLLKLKTFGSPISAIEHEAHLCIDSIDDKYQDDPERIYVAASPKDSFMFLKLKGLINNIQYEFDISWAVLGELYGTISKKPEIKYRRIKSNLDEEQFVASQLYVADHFSFKANDEIIKLLIAPLYGDDPTYGIRELLQNAIDACKERESVERKNQNNSYESSIKIEVVKEKSDHYFIISDNGIGMDIDVLKNYFLSAGASFRKSIEWQKEFIDNAGNSKIRRSGRFGIGVLAAFLIGYEIQVETKNLKEDSGYKFHSNINTEQINIIKDVNVPIGTVIKIRLDNNTQKKLDPDNKAKSNNINWFDWYTLSTPFVTYTYLNKKITLKKSNPELNNELPVSWNQIDSQGYNKIIWSYSSNFNPANFTCNGIVIPGDGDSHQIKFDLVPKIPKISVFDNNGFLPLNLNRNSFTKKLSFINDLEEDIYTDFIAYLLTLEVESIVEDDRISLAHQRLNYPGISGYYSNYCYSYGDYAYKYMSYIALMMRPFLISKNGYILDYSYFIKNLKKINVLFIQAESSLINLEIDIKNYFIKFSSDPLNSIEDYKVVIEPKIPNVWQAPKTRIFIKKSKYSYLFKSTQKRVSTWLNNLCKVQYDNHGWIEMHLGSPNETTITEKFLKKNSENINFIREHEAFSTYDGSKIMDKLLKRYIGDDVVIPFSMAERKIKYPLAFTELDRYMEKYMTPVKNRKP